MKMVLKAALSVDAGAVAKLHTDSEKIRQAIYEARVQAIRLTIS